MGLNVKNKIEAYRLLEGYIAKYGALYPKYALKHIRETFDYDINSNDVSREDIMRQIYAELGMLPDDMDLYKGFVDLIEKRYGIKGNILNVGPGYFPIEPKYIDIRQQQIGAGKITAYDPKLVIKELGNIRLVRSKFTATTNIKPYTLITGLRPCEAAEIMMVRAAQERKNFMVALCGCVHFSEEHLKKYFPTQDGWYNYISDKVMEAMGDSGYIDYEYFDSMYEYPYPVMCSNYTDEKKLIR